MCETSVTCASLCSRSDVWCMYSGNSHFSLAGWAFVPTAATHYLFFSPRCSTLQGTYHSPLPLSPFYQSLFTLLRAVFINLFNIFKQLILLTSCAISNFPTCFILKSRWRYILQVLDVDHMSCTLLHLTGDDYPGSLCLHEHLAARC